MSDRHFDQLATRFAEKIYGGSKGAIRLAVLQADLQGEIETHCTRCLEAMKVTANTHFEELFVFVERSQEEFEQLVPEDGYIDLAEPFRDYLLLEIPIHHLCRPDCKGICLECGQNLNLGQCEHINSQILFD